MKRAVSALRRAGRRGVGVVVGLVLVAGCGGDGEKTVSKEEYLKRASRICKEGNQELAAASQKAFEDVNKSGEKPTAEQLERYARDVVVPMVRRQVEELRALPDPEGAADQVDEIYDAFEKALDQVDDKPSLLTDNPNVFDVFKEADELSERYGFPVCT